MLEAYLVSLGTIFVAEFGDKSQLLAIVLATRFRNPRAVIAGMALGLFLNHALAGAVGSLLARFVSEDVLRWGVGLGFLAAAGFALLPIGESKYEVHAPVSGRNAFWVTAGTFFLVEMGDRTQLMIVALAARFETAVPVVLGATTGILMALVPAVIFADRLLARLPMRLIRLAAAALFAALGVATLLA